MVLAGRANREPSIRSTRIKMMHIAAIRIFVPEFISEIAKNEKGGFGEIAMIVVDVGCWRSRDGTVEMDMCGGTSVMS